MPVWEWYGINERKNRVKKKYGAINKQEIFAIVKTLKTMPNKIG